MNWQRATVFGILLWLVPFAVAFVLFGIRQDNRALFESIITVVGVFSAVVASVAYFSNRQPSLGDGVSIGLFWAAVSILIDLPVFLFIFNMPLGEYVADIAVSYLAFPIITTGIAVAKAAED